MSINPWIQLLAMGGAALVLQAGCDAQCGDGTIERGGKCVPADTSFEDPTCGLGTVLEGDQCVPEFEPTVCGDNTAAVEDPEMPGVIVCEGTGGAGGCASTLPCPSAGANKVTV